MLAIQLKNLDPADESEEEGEDEEDETESDAQLLFTGIVQELPADGTFIGSWLVSGVSINVDANTTIRQRVGPILVGSWVRIIGSGTGDGGIQASKVQAIRTQKCPQAVRYLG